MTYKSKPLRAPRMAGPLLGLSTNLAENAVASQVLAGALLDSAGVPEMRKVVVTEAHPILPPGMDLPTPGEGTEGKVPSLKPVAALTRPPGFAFERAADFVKAYTEGLATPTDVAARVLEVSRMSERRRPAMRFFIAQRQSDVMAQAEASAERYRDGKPLSPLDGVPIAVKDEVDQIGYPTTAGTAFLGKDGPATDDAGCVAPLRRAGAILIGKANMHEMGLGVTGINPIHGTARNPYDPARATGGSSSGPAACVAAGLCPIAVGADGGGSIRLPASLCGVVGVKPTFGRVSERGAAPLCWSVAHIGPIAATVADAALGFAYMAGPDPKDPNTHGRPPVTLDALGTKSLKGVRLGVMRPWFEDADAAVVKGCRHALDILKDADAEIVEIEIPDLNLVRTAHLVTIVSEMSAAHLPYYDQHRQDYSFETRLNLALARKLTAYDYVHAQRLRARIAQRFAEALGQVDAILTPSTGCTAPTIAADALKTGESNLEILERIMRFAPAANLTGHPAVSVPVGYDVWGLPVGLQIMGRFFEEHVLLRIAAAVEREVERRAPRVHYKLLPPE